MVMRDLMNAPGPDWDCASPMEIGRPSKTRLLERYVKPVALRAYRQSHPRGRGTQADAPGQP